MIHPDNDLVSLVEPIIKQAGDILLAYYAKPLVRYEKKGHGFVTEADLASEKFLIAELAKLIPHVSFFAEESGQNGPEQSPYCWVIDPLDGTTNFAQRLPYFCISVALTYKDEPIFAMLYQPLLKELFYAIKGQGAYLNGQRIRVAQAPVDRGIVAIGLPYAKDQKYAQLLRDAWQIARRVYAIRHFGAVALDLAYVAAGRLDAVVFEELGWWDVAAGMLLVSEAGGFVSDFQGEKLGPKYLNCIASSSVILQKELKELVKAHV